MKVYAGGKEFQLEELRAIEYFLKSEERKRTSNGEHSFQSIHNEGGGSYLEKIPLSNGNQTSNISHMNGNGKQAKFP